MKKIIVFVLLAICITSSAILAQDAKKTPEKVATKFDTFTSKTGVITKIVDTKLPALTTPKYGGAYTRIRKVSQNKTNLFFYQLEKESKYGKDIASIEYSDLLEIIKAMTPLKESAVTDKDAESDYLENKFVTVDGFQIGYVKTDGEFLWYIKFGKYSTDTTIFFEKVEVLENALTNAKLKIEELKSLK